MSAPASAPVMSASVSAAAFAPISHPLAAGDLLRPLRQPDEAEAIASMLAAQDPWRTLGYGADALARYLRREDPGLHRFAVVLDETPAAGAAAGVVCVRYPWLRGPYIELIGFAASAQGRGLGGAIIGWMESEVRGLAANLWAFVSESNAGARRFYAAHGFAEVVPVDDLVAPGHAEILLRKRLDRQQAQSADRSEGRPSGSGR